MGLWNQPAAYRTNGSTETNFNYFAALVPNAFLPIKAGEYRMLNQMEYKDTGWYTGGKLIGNNQITYSNSGNKHYTLNENLPIWVVKTDTVFFREFGKRMSYDQILNTFYKNKNHVNAEDYLFKQIRNSDTLISFLINQSIFDWKRNYMNQFDFKGYSIISQLNEEDFLSDLFKNTIESWSKNNYLQDSSTLIRIPTWKDFDISVRKIELLDKTSFTDGESIFYDLHKISSAYNIPKKTQINYKSTFINLSINSKDQTLYSTSELTDINNIGTMVGNFKALWGGAHSTFKKNIKNPWILPSLTIGSLGLTAISIGCRNLLYQAYLKAPNQRSNYYSWANGFNKSIVPLLGIYTLGFTIDLGLATHDKKQINSEFKGLKGIDDASPVFPGGYAELNKFINENIDFPQEAIDLGIQGQLIVHFVVEETGQISNVYVANPLAGCKTCDLAAVKVVEKMPYWIPGKNKGRVCRKPVTLPINFTIK
jgi:TonB family protein